jgi:hypothetical protein
MPGAGGRGAVPVVGLHRDPGSASFGARRPADLPFAAASTERKPKAGAGQRVGEDPDDADASRNLSIQRSGSVDHTVCTWSDVGDGDLLTGACSPPPGASAPTSPRRPRPRPLVWSVARKRSGRWRNHLGVAFGDLGQYISAHLRGQDTVEPMTSTAGLRLVSRNGRALRASQEESVRMGRSLAVDLKGTIFSGLR